MHEISRARGVVCLYAVKLNGTMTDFVFYAACICTMNEKETM